MQQHDTANSSQRWTLLQILLPAAGCASAYCHHGRDESRGGSLLSITPSSSKAVVGHIGRLLTACTRAERVRPTALRSVCLRRIKDVASSDRGSGKGKGRPHVQQAMSPPTKRLAAPRSLTADSSDTATSILRPPDRFARASLAPGNTCRAAFAPTANILTCVTSRTNGGCNSTWRRRCL